MLTGRRIGLEVTPRAVRVAVVRRLGGQGWVRSYHEIRLEPGIFVPSWEGENIRAEEAFRNNVYRVLKAARVPPARVRLVVPDLTARLRILESEPPPAHPRGLHDYAAWRLRDELVPTGARVAPVFYMNGHPTRGYLAVLMGAAAAIAQIERLVRAAGAEPARITSTAAALFDLLGSAWPGRREEKGALLVVADLSATLIVTSDGAPVFARTFRTTWAEGRASEAAAGLCRDIAVSLKYCLECDLKLPERILLAGECAHVSGLPEALARRLGIPCHLAEPSVRLRRRGRVPPDGIGALAGALC